MLCRVGNAIGRFRVSPCDGPIDSTDRHRGIRDVARRQARVNRLIKPEDLPLPGATAVGR